MLSRMAHNHEVGGWSPSPATKRNLFGEIACSSSERVRIGKDKPVMG